MATKLVFVMSSFAWIAASNGTDNSQFDPVEARRFFDFAAASYTSHVDKCLAVIPGNFKLVWKKKAKCDWKTNCFAFISISDTSKAIVVAFRGSTSNKMVIKQVLENLAFFKKPVLGGSVYRYFYNAYRAFQPEMKRIIKCLVKDNPTYDIWVTGHSLGGAIASIFSVKLLDKEIIVPEKLRTITFGMPRVGTYKYARSYDKMHKNSFRVVHRNDVVAHLPPCLTVGANPDCVGSKFTTYPYHHSTEIWYDNDMSSEQSSYKVCLENPKNEDRSCSNSRVPIIKHMFRDHANYYGVHVSTYGKAGCPGSKPPVALHAIEWGVRLWGHYQESITGSAEECRIKCISDQNCKAITFGTRNLRKGWNSCYLFATWNQKTFETGWAAWFKYEDQQEPPQLSMLTTMIPELDDYDVVSNDDEDDDEDGNGTFSSNYTSGCNEWIEGPCVTNQTLNEIAITNEQFNSSTMDVKKCQEFCDSKNCAIAALWQGTNCQCGIKIVEAPNTFSNSCNIQCSGNVNETCGGMSAATLWLNDDYDYDIDDDDADDDDNIQSTTVSMNITSSVTNREKVLLTEAITYSTINYDNTFLSQLCLKNSNSFLYLDETCYTWTNTFCLNGAELAMIISVEHIEKLFRAYYLMYSINWEAFNLTDSETSFYIDSSSHQKELYKILNGTKTTNGYVLHVNTWNSSTSCLLLSWKNHMFVISESMDCSTRYNTLCQHNIFNQICMQDLKSFLFLNGVCYSSDGYYNDVPPASAIKCPTGKALAIIKSADMVEKLWRAFFENAVHWSWETDYGLVLSYIGSPNQQKEQYNALNGTKSNTGIPLFVNLSIADVNPILVWKNRIFYITDRLNSYWTFIWCQTMYNVGTLTTFTSTLATSSNSSASLITTFSRPINSTPQMTLGTTNLLSRSSTQTVTNSPTSKATSIIATLTQSRSSKCSWIYRGCFANNPWNVHVLVNGSNYIRSVDLTIESCQTYCLTSRNYKFASLDYGNACHCGSGFLTNATQGTESNCAMVCPGNKTQICGGPWVNSVYECKE